MSDDYRRSSVAPFLVPVERVRRTLRSLGRLLPKKIVAQEREEAKRVVLETASFMAVVPFAAAVPFEVWLLPLGHSPDFASISDAQLEDMTIALGRILRAYGHVMIDPEYNLVIHSVPDGFQKAAYLHWYIQILPRLTVAAGFELGTGMYVNSSVPEQDAAILANAVRTMNVQTDAQP